MIPRLGLGISSVLWAFVAFAEANIRPETFDEKALKVYLDYWSTFAAYKNKAANEGKNKFSASVDELRQRYEAEKAKLDGEKLEALQQAVKEYRVHLERFPEAENRPHVLLDLAQVLHVVGKHVKASDANSGGFAQKEAIALIEEIEHSYRYFERFDAALYLKALVQIALDLNDSALKTWHVLAQKAAPSIYGVHAHVALGDYFFGQEQPDQAFEFYAKSLSVLDKLSFPDREAESFRIHYRLMWAAFRLGRAETAINSGLILLAPSPAIVPVAERDAVQKDAIEILGDSIFEEKHTPQMKAHLQKISRPDFAAAVGLHLLNRLHGSELVDQTVALGDYMLQRSPQAVELPQILWTTADSYQKLGRPNKAFEVLETLALLLPADSLWRKRHKDTFNAVVGMEELAQKASVRLADEYFRRGINTNDGKSFLRAATFYAVLFNNVPGHKDVTLWRKRHADCYFFGAKLGEAGEQYEYLKTRVKSDDPLLQDVLYQLVLSREASWRNAYGKAMRGEKKPEQDKDVKLALTQLESAIDDYVNKFSDRPQAVDMLLVGANTNRESGTYERAAHFWERALLLNPTVAQKTIALRGIIFATLQSQGAGRAVDETRKFLRLEDWNTLGKPLRSELLGVLASATSEETKRLSDGGNLKDSGILGVKIAEEFTDLPNRPQIYRDSAYTLALAGEWLRAQQAAQNFLASAISKNRGDMHYLLARAHEYQLHFVDAARAYYLLAEKHPEHSRARSSLERCELLAAGENDFELAGDAVRLLGLRLKQKKEKLAAFGRASDLYLRARNYEKANAAAAKLVSVSVTLDEQLRAKLIQAHTFYESGDEVQGIALYGTVANQAQYHHAKLGDDAWAELLGESSAVLGDEARKSFDSLELHGNPERNLESAKRKTDIFDLMIGHYRNAVSTNHGTWAARARHRLAEACETFAQELAHVFLASDYSTTLKAYARYHQQIKQLRAIAERNFSDNVLLGTKNPELYAQNLWIKKSLLRVAGYNSKVKGQSFDPVMPLATHLDLPYQWSYQ